MFSYMIEWTGTEEHKRFLISSRGDKKYWAGNGWTPQIKDALLFATHQDACREFGKLAEEYFRGSPVREFEVLAKVKVFTDRPFTLEELREYLSAVCTLVMVQSYRGAGPVEDSFAQVEIPWDRLCEATPSQPCDEGQGSTNRGS